MSTQFRFGFKTYQNRYILQNTLMGMPDVIQTIETIETNDNACEVLHQSTLPVRYHSG